MLETYRQLKTLSKRITNVHVSVYAGNASFFLMIAAFPALMMLMTLLQYTPLTESDVTSALSSVVPDTFQPLIEYILYDLYASSAGTVISISAVSAIWLASKGVMGVLSGLNAVYGVDETRSYLLRRFISMIYMVALLVALLLTLVLHVFGRKLEALLAQRFRFLAKIFAIALHFRVLVLIGLLSLLFASCFLALPNHKVRFRSVLPGALLSAVGWVVFSSAFSFYINNFAHYSHFYGSLTTLVVSMLWLFFCMNILFYGGMVNARLDERRVQRENRRNRSHPSTS